MQCPKQIWSRVLSVGLLCWGSIAIQRQNIDVAVFNTNYINAVTSFGVLQDIQRDLPVDIGKAANALGNVVTYVQDAMRDQKMTLPQNLKPFVIISQQQSGLNWVNTLLDSHPDIITISTDVFGGWDKFDGTLEDAFLREVGAITQKLTAANDTNSTKWLGIKLQTIHEDKIQDGLHMANMTFIFHWRRNVLRQLLSSAFALQKPGNESISFDFVDLQCLISRTLVARSKVYAQVEASGSHVCPISHFEDWLVPDTRGEVERSIFDCLGVEPAPLLTPYASNHETLPVLNRVENADMIKLILNNSKYEYMLEEFASSSEVLSKLKATDAFDKQPPSIESCGSKTPAAVNVRDPEW